MSTRLFTGPGQAGVNKVDFNRGVTVIFATKDPEPATCVVHFYNMGSLSTSAAFVLQNILINWNEDINQCVRREDSEGLRQEIVKMFLNHPEVFGSLECSFAAEDYAHKAGVDPKWINPLGRPLVGFILVTEDLVDLVTGPINAICINLVCDKNLFVPASDWEVKKTVSFDCGAFYGTYLAWAKDLYANHRPAPTGHMVTEMDLLGDAGHLKNILIGQLPLFAIDFDPTGMSFADAAKFCAMVLGSKAKSTLMEALLLLGKTPYPSPTPPVAYLIVPTGGGLFVPVSER